MVRTGQEAMKELVEEALRAQGVKVPVPCEQEDRLEGFPGLDAPEAEKEEAVHALLPFANNLAIKTVLADPYCVQILKEFTVDSIQEAHDKGKLKDWFAYNASFSRSVLPDGLSQILSCIHKPLHRSLFGSRFLRELLFDNERYVMHYTIFTSKKPNKPESSTMPRQMYEFLEECIDALAPSTLKPAAKVEYMKSSMQKFRKLWTGYRSNSSLETQERVRLWKLQNPKKSSPTGKKKMKTEKEETSSSESEALTENLCEEGDSDEDVAEDIYLNPKPGCSSDPF